MIGTLRAKTQPSMHIKVCAYIRHNTVFYTTGFLQAQLSKIQGLFKDKFILFKALFDNNTYTQFIENVTFRALSPIFVTSISL